VEVSKQHIVDILEKTGFGAQAEQLMSSLSDPVDVDELANLLVPYGITQSELVSRMGGSP
jgi:hypothetical protein